MNKQELIKEIEENGIYCLNVFGNEVKSIPVKRAIGLIKQLDERQKVKVSEEEEKFLKTFDFNCENDVTKALYNVSRVGWGYYLTDNNGIELKDLTEGFRNLENRKRLIKAILDGYTVEEEKRYTVVMKTTKQPLYYNAMDKKLFFSMGGLATKFTRKQLEEAGFGWVFNCEGVEIEEVD